MPMSVEYRLRALKIGRVPQGAQEDDFYLVTELKLESSNSSFFSISIITSHMN